MKTFIFTRKVLTIFMMAICCLFSSKMVAQIIQIDTTFTSDGEIFPFGLNDTIYGLSISGSVSLSSDTSLVRVILTDNSGNEWMVYEAYPMIIEDSVFEIHEVCDETCFLEEFLPNSILIQIIDAEIIISYLTLRSIRLENLPALQYQAKRNKDLEKAQLMNQYIASRGWEWIADTTGLVKMFYQHKIQMFNNKYNLLGLDYYSGGVFNSILHDNIPRYTETTIISSFDWREKHNAHLSETHYYGGDAAEPDNGWMTGIRTQVCGSCAAFASIASLEAAINLYANYQFDKEENIRFSERDAFNCSAYNTGNVGCDCSGKSKLKIMNKLRDEGVVDEECYSRDSNPPYCQGIAPTCSAFSSKCTNPTMTAQICEYVIYDLDQFNDPDDRAAFLKKLILDNGPLTITLKNWWPAQGQEHALSLVGFDIKDDEIVWVLKNSWGLDTEWGEAGYITESFWLGSNAQPPGVPSILNNVFAFDYTCSDPITVISYVDPEFEYVIHENDFDQDGYYNWGIGKRPQHDYPCGEDVEEEDSNDDDSRIGPYEDDYSGRPIKPEMNLQLGEGIGIPIANGDLVFLEGNNSNDITYTFAIINSGTAQLNLERDNISAHGKVTIEYQNFAGKFEITRPPDTSVCMNNNYTSFDIKLHQGTETGPLAHIHIYLDEPDMDPIFEFTLVFNSCETAVGNDIIENEVKWDQPFRTQVRDLKIKRNGVLSILGTVILSREVDIIVEQGGKLIIDGGKLTGSCNNLWRGIDIGGDPREPQTYENQGMVGILNGGCIENATTAIETGNAPDPERSPSGGIVTCTDAIFKDNLTDIHFYPFTNTHPITHQILSNSSSFTKTRFETTEDFYDLFNEIPNTHILMDEVGGISILGCSFGNYSTQTIDSRGNGIESYGAGYVILPACAYNIIPCPGMLSCRFENLDYGIRAFNSNSLFTIIVNLLILLTITGVYS
jgi:hypothetical protein